MINRYIQKVAIVLLTVPFAANATLITYSGTFSAEDPTFTGTITAFFGSWTAVVDDTDFLTLTGVGFEVVNGTLTSLTMSPSLFGSTIFDTTNTGFQIGVFDGVAGNMAVGGLEGGVGGVSPSGGVDDWFANYFPGTNFSANGAPLDGLAAEASWSTAVVNDQGQDSNHGGNFGVVPIPAAVWLFGSALGFLGWIRRTAT